jgi:hypothetical protein
MNEIPSYKELIIINKNLLKQIQELLRKWGSERNGKNVLYWI